jgi:hypothetical protein
MAMYLGEWPVFMIMLIGRWSSDAFLRYIRKQVMEFSQNVAKKMLSCQNFRHIPDVNRRIPSDDPCIQNHPNNAETRKMLVETHTAMSDCLRLLYTAEQPLPECLSYLNWWWKHIGKPDMGLGEGFFDRLLEHRFKPSPSGRTISLDAFAYFISLSFILHIFLWSTTSQRS